MQYSVPQFIDVEDKIVGPFTGKQTLFLIIGFGVMLVSFSLFNFFFFILIAIPDLIMTLAFAFWKPKGFTVSKWITNIMDFYTTPHLYVWRRDPEIRMFKQSSKNKPSHEDSGIKLSKNRIKELAWLLDTSTSVNMPYEVRTRPEDKL